MFQSPYGGIGRSDPRDSTIYSLLQMMFQSPCGDIGASDQRR